MRKMLLASVFGLSFPFVVLAQTPPMPGPNTRPQILPGHVLKWSGPVGGGASNGSYVPQTRTLRPVSGTVTSSADGQVIEGLDITGPGSLSSGVITVRHNNVTVRQNHIMEVSAGQPDRYTVYVAAGVTGTVIEDNLIDGHAQNGAGGTSCVSGAVVGNDGPGVANAIMRRNTCIRSEQMIRYVLNNDQITENWWHRLGGTDADGVEVYPNGGSVNNLLIQYNVFDGTNNAAGGADSGVNLTTGSGLPVGNIGPNVVIDHNWFVNWSGVHAIVADGSSGGQLSFVITNNGCYHCLNNISPLDGSHPNDSGNYIMATPTSLTGKPYNGTGKF